MNITAVFQGTYPNGGAMSKRLHLYCKGLMEQGQKVNIIIPHESIPYGRDISIEPVGVYEMVPYSYLSKKTTRSKHFLTRRVNDIRGYIKLCRYLINNSQKTDVILVVDVRNMFPILLYYIAKIINAKVVYEINEHPLIITTKIKFRFDKKLVYPLYDGFITISQPLNDLIQNYKNKNSIILNVPIISEEKKLTYSGMPKVSLEKPYIFHSGSLIEKKDGIMGMISSFNISITTYGHDINYYFTGLLELSPNYIEIKSLIERLKLTDRIYFLDYLPENELTFYQQNAALTIINKEDNLQNKFCFPTKLGEYLSLGIPVICTDTGPIREYLEDNVTAFLVEPSNPELLANKIHYILTHPSESKIIGQNGKNLAKTHFNYQNQSKKILDFFYKLVG